MMRHFNVKLSVFRKQIEYAVASRLSRVKLSPLLLLKLDHAIEMSSRVKFKCGIIEKPLDGALIMAVLIKQARNFLLLIKNRYT